MAVCAATDLPVLGEDSGIEVDALRGWPGPMSARWMGDQATDVDRLRGLLAEVERPRVGSLLILDRPRLAQETRQRIRELFRFLWDREGWPVGRMSFDAWDRLAAVVLDETAGIDLPDGIRVCCRERVVQVGPAE